MSGCFQRSAMLGLSGFLSTPGFLSRSSSSAPTSLYNSVVAMAFLDPL